MASFLWRCRTPIPSVAYVLVLLETTKWSSSLPNCEPISIFASVREHWQKDQLEELTLQHAWTLCNSSTPTFKILGWGGQWTFFPQVLSFFTFEKALRSATKYLRNWRRWVWVYIHKFDIFLTLCFLKKSWILIAALRSPHCDRA